MLVALVVSLLLFVLYLGFWTNWFMLAGGPTSSGPSTTASTGSNGANSSSQLAGDQHASWGWVMTGLLIGVPIICMLSFTWRERRSARKQFESLPTPEQERRRQAAALLRQVEPPVDEATAREQLRAPVSAVAPREGPSNN